MPVIVRLTTHVCHAKERVAFEGWTPPASDDVPRFDVRNGPYIPIAELTFPMKARALANLEAAREFAETWNRNKTVDNANPDRGVITMGLPFLSLMDVLQGAAQKPDILRLGIVYPLARRRVGEFLRAHREVKILEELDNELEKDVKMLAYDLGLTTRIIGKLEPEEWMGEYTPDKVAKVLRRCWPDMLPEPWSPAEPIRMVPERPPQMCPGCGHRSAFHAIRQALADTDITVADIGCHTLGFLPPYQTGQLLMCMGASTGIGSGLSLFNTTRKVVAFLGDSTFFHAGLPGVINALFNRHNLTLIVMENGTTAMTGHQDHAASGRNFNEAVEKIPIRRVLEGLGVDPIFEVDTYRQDELTALVRKAVDAHGFSVVIAHHPCMLKFTRAARRNPGYRPHQVRIDPSRCRKIHSCVARFGCPSFARGADGEVWINVDLCIGDGSCLQTCPVQAVEKPRAVESSE